MGLFGARISGEENIVSGEEYLVENVGKDSYASVLSYYETNLRKRVEKILKATSRG